MKPLEPLYVEWDCTLQEYATYLSKYNERHGDAAKLEKLPEIGEGCKADLKPEVPDAFSKKAPMHALPLTKLETLARVLAYGNDKYKKDNWIGTANDPDRYIGAALRHLAAIRAGEMYDESGLPHVGHLQASVLILEEALRNAGLLK